MTESEEIVYAAIAGLTIWFLQKIIVFFVIKSRVSQGLLSEIIINLKQIKEAKAYLEKLETVALVEGSKIDYLDKFAKTDCSFYKSQIHELPRYFNKRTLDKITKFFNSFWELQVIIEGFMSYLHYLHDCNITLTNKEIERASMKLTRMYKLMDVILVNKINKLSDLIEDYEGRLGAETILKNKF